MVKHKQAFLGLTWQSLRGAMKRDPNRREQHKWHNKTMEKEFKSALANPAKLLFKNDFPHSEHKEKV